MPYKYRKLDELCRRELGSTPQGWPIYRWMHANDPELMHKAKVGIDYRCQCGLNKMVHRPACSGVVVPEQRFELRTWPDLDGVWVMARWRPPRAPRDPRTGYYVPVSYWGRKGDGAPQKYISLDPGVSPTLKITEAFVKAMKRELDKRVSEIENEGIDLAEKKDTARRQARRDAIDDALGPYWKIPGKRGYNTVLPDPNLQAKGDAAPAYKPNT